MAEDDAINEFEATYKLYSKGMEIGVMARAFTRSGTNNSEYIYRSETHTTGLAAIFHKDKIVEQSILILNENSLRPLDYSYTRTGGKKNRIIKVNFDWKNQKITNVVNDTTMLMPLNNNVLDKLIYQYVIMRDLKKNNFPASYTIVDGRKIKSYNFDLDGEEILETPIGTFKTIKVVRHKPNSDDKTYLWCAPALQYLPIKVENIEKDSWTTVAVIESLNGLTHETNVLFSDNPE